MKEKGKKIAIILSSIIISALFAVGVGIAFFVGYAPKVPASVKIVDDGNNVYLLAEMNDNYSSYKFTFEDEEGQNIIINSKTNLLSIDDLTKEGVELGVEYNITVRYIGDDELSSSQTSNPISWKSYTYLDVPNVYENADYVSWSYVYNADYYELHYSAFDGEKVIKKENPYIYKKEIESGERNIFIVAVSNDAKYKNSTSQTEKFFIIHSVPNFEGISFNDESAQLTMTSLEEIKKIDVYVGETLFEIRLNPVINGDEYIYNVDLSGFYHEGDYLAIKPSTIDEYNIYNGDFFVVREGTTSQGE